MNLVSSLLGISAGEAATCLARLRELPAVEPFAARGPGAVNVHENARLALRARMRAERPEHFMELSKRLYELVRWDATVVAVAEADYHRAAFESRRPGDESPTASPALPVGGMEGFKTMKVFLSSTTQDLVTYRQVADDTILRLSQQVVAMERFGLLPGGARGGMRTPGSRK